MPLVLKWQEILRKQKILCELYSRDLWYSEYASGSQYTKILHVSGFIMPEFHRVC